MSYIDKDDLENYLGVTLSITVTGFIAMAETYIEKYCGGRHFAKRWFEDDDEDKTFRYDGNDNTKITIDDLRELTSLTVDDEALTEDEDFHLYPLNADGYNMPYEWIELIQPETRLLNVNSRLSSAPPYIFDKGQRTIVIVGKFGYSTTAPEDIKVAALKLAGGIIKENIGDSKLREITKESLGDYSVDYAKLNEIANKLGIHNILQPYIKNGIQEVSEAIKVS